jgi:hypothetical protein
LPLSTQGWDILASSAYERFCIYIRYRTGKKSCDQIDSDGIYQSPHLDKPLPFEPKVPLREISEIGIHEFVNKKLIRVSGLSDPF